MRILLVAPQSKDTPLGVIGNFCRKALVNLGYNIEVFDFRENQYFKGSIGKFLKNTINKFYNFSREEIPLARFLQKEKMNRALITRVKQCRPDVAFVLMGDDVSVETLETIKKQGVITANWFTDTVIDPRRQRIQFIKNIPSHYNYFFIYDNEDVLNFIEIDAPCIRSVPLACDPSVHKSMTLTEDEKNKYGSQVCFVGTLDWIEGTNRHKLLESLIDFDLGIWGDWKKESPELKGFYRKKHVFFEEATKIYNASDITIDIHIFYGSNNKAFDINPRVFEATASGAFVLTNESKYLADLYQIDKEIVCYKDKEELREKIKYYLEHPDERKIIAQRGQQRAHRDHTYENRFKKIFSIIKKEC